MSDPNFMRPNEQQSVLVKHGRNRQVLLVSEWTEGNTREAVKGRSGGVCEYCEGRRATDMHHRKSRGVGGAWEPANILHLCVEDHRFATDNPLWAYAHGVSLTRATSPSETPVIRANKLQFQPSNDVSMGPDKKEIT